MPSKIHERASERDLSGIGSKLRDRPRHKSSRSKRKSSKEHDEIGTLERSSTLAESSTRRRASMPIPELQRRASSTSLNGITTKTSFPYPKFSKAHSREAISSEENINNDRANVYTPDPTDLQKRAKGKDQTTAAANVAATNGPPSPPLTAVDQAAVVEDKRRDLEAVTDEMRKQLAKDREQRDIKTKSGERTRSSSTRGSPRRSSKADDKSSIPSSQRSKLSTPTKLKPKLVSVEDGSSLGSRQESRSPSTVSSSRTTTETVTESTIDSESTSIAPHQLKAQQPFTPDADNESTPASDPDSSPKTPTPRGTPFPPGRNETPAYTCVDNPSTVVGSEYSPMPPPPPPPPTVPYQIPRVDYLVQNGGLHQTIQKTFLFAPRPTNKSQGISEPCELGVSMAAQVERFFAPFNNLLEDYSKVMIKNGSLAVATGYRSIARRLLDRLEAVFARDISSETCTCFMCRSTMHDADALQDERGISWGEILEYVCGRQELPAWPAFTLDSASVGLGISATEHRLPMQKLDIDVPEEYREHYIRQSKKTKQSVDRWLGSQPSHPSSPPQDVDDDTLTFAMLTHLEPEQRSTFTSLLGISPSRPASRAATPLNEPKSDLLHSVGFAIQRLYRLTNPPRHPECAIYLLNNPHLHNVLATIAAVSDGEWEILISGRFDGFLRSGAEDNYQAPLSTSRGPTPAGGRTSRGPTFMPTSSTPLSASAGAPVAMDEETEIAVLAEVEREIYLGMEALEDAFEALHGKAEDVRRRLRERGAGLSIANQTRRGGGESLEARLGTPASGIGFRGWESETDDGIDDAMSELAPDDSASNVSSSRHRRPKRRNERRTPAPVEEEDEEGSDVYTKLSMRR